MSGTLDSGNGRPRLPEGWVWKTMGEVCEPIQKIKPTDRPEDEFRYIDISAIDRMTKTIGDVQTVLGRSAPSRARQLVAAGDVLVATVRPNLQSIAAVPAALNGEVASTGFCVLRAGQGIEPMWLFYWTLTTTFLTSLLKKARGVSYPGVLDKDVRSQPIPVPPLQEQSEIVPWIETQLWAVDEGVNCLCRAVDLLFPYAATLRHAACSGQLSSARNGDGLPDGWSWRAVASLAADEPRAITDGPFGSNLKTEHYTDAGPRVIRLQNVGEDEFKDFDAHISAERFESLRAHEAKPGDVVIAALGEVLPRACVVPKGIGPAIVKADCPRVRPGPDISAEYLSLALNSPSVRSQASGIVHGVGRPRLNLREIKALHIPVPPRQIQDAIVQTVQPLLSTSRDLAVAIGRLRDASSFLRQSILHGAFEGRLSRPEESARA